MNPNKMVGPIPIPEVRLVLDGMRATIVHTFAEAIPKWQQVLEAEVEKALSAENFARLVRDEVERSIQYHMKHAVDTYLYDALRNKEITDIIAAQVTAKVAEVMARRAE